MAGFLTAEQRERLLHNGRRSAATESHDPKPVVKLFTPDGSATWLLTELDPNNPDIAFGLCDLGFGEPELGTVWLSELQRCRGPHGLSIEVDRNFTALAAISVYANAARDAGRITEDVDDYQQTFRFS